MSRGENYTRGEGEGEGYRGGRGGHGVREGERTKDTRGGGDGQRIHGEWER